MNNDRAVERAAVALDDADDQVEAVLPGDLAQPVRPRPGDVDGAVPVAAEPLAPSGLRDPTRAPKSALRVAADERLGKDDEPGAGRGGRAGGERRPDRGSARGRKRPARPGRPRHERSATSDLPRGRRAAEVGGDCQERRRRGARPRLCARRIPRPSRSSTIVSPHSANGNVQNRSSGRSRRVRSTTLKMPSWPTSSVHGASIAVATG